MGYRWDVGKRFFAVTHADFRQGVDIVQRLMENFTAQPSVLSVDFYNQLKYGAAPTTAPASASPTEAARHCA